MIIGTGYSSDRQLLLQGCIRVDNSSFLDSPKSIVLFNGVTSYTETAVQLGQDISIHGRIDLGIISADITGTVKLTEEIKETDYSQSFVFSVNAQLPSLRLNLNQYGEAALTDAAFEAYKTNLDRFNAMCGDQFVLQESRTASLYISTKLEFITRSEKVTFSIDGSKYLKKALDLLTLNTDHISVALTQYRMSLSIAVLQKGGDLNELRAATPEISIDQTGFGTFSCVKRSSKNIQPELDKCKDVMHRLFDYASNQFPASVDAHQDTVPSLDMYNMRYDSIGIKLGPYVPSQQVLQIRAHLAELYKNFTTAQQFINNLLYDVPSGKQYMNISNVQVGWNYTSINSTLLSKLHLINDTISDAIPSILSKTTTCYDSPRACVDFTDPLNLTTVQIFQKAYIVKSNCDGTIYGPRYALPIGNDLYKEDSVFQNSSALVTTYNIVQKTPTTIHVTMGPNCDLPMDRSQSYDLVDVYYQVFGSSCSIYLCPSGTINSVGVEFITTETPI